MNNPKASLRRPTPTDGIHVYRLIKECESLDLNSAYCNLLQCTHFSDTSVIAESGEKILGFTSGYRIPQRPNTLFIWQVAVSAAARGQGIAKRMLENLLTHKANADLRFIEASITESNQASWALFKSLASSLECELTTSTLFDKTEHFAGDHDSELLVKIGPFRD